MNTICIIGGPLYQWDTKRKLKIELPDGIREGRVDFCTRWLEKPIPVKTYIENDDVVANIPDVLLQDDLKIIAYVVIENEKWERTIFEKQLEINSRPKPPDYIYTETEIKRYEALEERVDKISEDIENLKENGTDGTAIIDVAELPSENINDKALYRLVSGTFIENGIPVDECQCFFVDELPEIGVPIKSENGSIILNASYYHTQEGKLYVFLVDEACNDLGLQWGWNEFAVFLDAFGVHWDGIITDLNDATEPDTAYFLLEKTLYAWNGKWVALKDNGTSVEGLVEITDGEPTKEGTVLTVNPNAEEVHLYTAEEVDAIKDTWELIVNHTVEENCSTILFTEDVNGKTFNLKKMFVFVKMIANTEESTSNAYLKINTDSTISRGDQNALAYTFATCPKSTEDYCKGYVILEKVGDVVVITESRKSSNHTTVKDNLVNSHDYANSMLYHKDENGFHKKIDQINLISHSNRIGAGSTIVAYGIRESES